MPNTSDRADTLRIRDNQRRSRARRKEYLHDLEKRLRAYELRGVEASTELQQAARQVADENKRLRLLLENCGVADHTINAFLRSSSSPAQLGGGGGPQPVSGHSSSEATSPVERLLVPRRPVFHDSSGSGSGIGIDASPPSPADIIISSSKPDGRKKRSARGSAGGPSGRRRRRLSSSASPAAPGHERETTTSALSSPSTELEGVFDFGELLVQPPHCLEPIIPGPAVVELNAVDAPGLTGSEGEQIPTTLAGSNFNLDPFPPVAQEESHCFGDMCPPDDQHANASAMLDLAAEYLPISPPAEATTPYCGAAVTATDNATTMAAGLGPGGNANMTIGDVDAVAVDDEADPVKDAFERYYSSIATDYEWEAFEQLLAI